MEKCEAKRLERRLRAKAKKLLRSPYFFNKFLRAMKKSGLVGEQHNALVLLVVAVSRLLPRPLNVFVKGHSSSGKNWLVTRVLRLLPKHSLAEITSASEKAWNYARSTFHHTVIYLQERNEEAGSVHPMRLLISEGKLVRLIPTWRHGKRVTKKQIAYGPVASISTTTKNRLEIDDETRHLSIWVDQSEEQTRQIVRSYTTKKRTGLSRKKVRVWRMVQQLLEERIAVEIRFPRWFDKIADQLYVGDLRVRRYYPAFLEACRTVCLIRSFQPNRMHSDCNSLTVDFADFAIAALIFDRVFVESLHLNQGMAEHTRRLVESISSKKRRPVGAQDIARKLQLSKDRAYAKLRAAAKAGVIRQANQPTQGNRKLFLAASQPRFIPDPKKLFRRVRDVEETVKFVHPITGEWLTYRHKK